MKKLNTFNSLQYPNFRNYFIGHTLSTLGTWVQQVTLAWLVYDLTRSTTLLGIIGFCALIPQLVVSPFAGVVIDKVDKKKFLFFIQILFFIQTICLGLIYRFDYFTADNLIAMSLLLGVLTAIDTPLRQSLLSVIIDQKEALPNALALNAMIFNASRFIGPPIAGLLISLIGPEKCFYLNAFSYLCLAIAVYRMKTVISNKAKGNMRDVMFDGFKHVFHNPLFRTLMISVMVLNMTASSYVTLLPVYAKDVLNGNEQTLGILWGFAGIGSLISSFILASKTNFTNSKNIILINIIICGIGLLLLGMSKTFYFLYIAMFLLGYGISTTNILTNIILQNLTDEMLRGRVISIYTSTRFGFDALGGLVVGFIASRYLPHQVMMLYSIILLSFASFYLRKKLII